MLKKNTLVKAELMELIIGIDEVGRGPIAGPVAVGAFAVRMENMPKIRRIFKGVKESKQLNAGRREFWKVKVDEFSELGICKYKVTMVSSKIIDQKGLTFAINKALIGSLEHVLSQAGKNNENYKDNKDNKNLVKILLDGGLKAPADFTNQKTIIKGDEKEMLIALASIVAKVTRDQYMIRLARKHPTYGFEIHKGYGTKRHYEEIKQNGLTTEHRRLFL